MNHVGTSKAIRAVIVVLILSLLTLIASAIIGAPAQDRPAIILSCAVAFGTMLLICIFTYRLSRRSY